MTRPPRGPLEGRTILDCSALLPGPFTARLLAMLGARVIKVESPKRPDGARAVGHAYEYLNSIKEQAALDLTDPSDRSRFAELVRGADALVEGFRPAAKKKLGLDEETLHAINPRLVIGSLIGYPEDGPWRDRAGHDMNFQAVTGALSMFSELPGLPLGDLFGAYALALEIAAALDSAARTGKGRRVVVPMTRAIEDALGLWIHEFKATGHEPRHGTTLMSGLYPCYSMYVAGDGRKITVGAIEHKFWEKVCAILAIPECVSLGYAIGAEGEATKQKVQSALGSRPWAHWEPLFDAADCCVEPVREFHEIY